MEFHNYLKDYLFFIVSSLIIFQIRVGVLVNGIQFAVTIMRRTLVLRV